VTAAAAAAAAAAATTTTTILIISLPDFYSLLIVAGVFFCQVKIHVPATTYRLPTLTFIFFVTLSSI